MNPAPNLIALAKRKGICNGCGAKGSWLKAPPWLEGPECDEHDILYWIGGDKWDKRHADRTFFAAMKRTAAKAPWWQRPGKYTRAWIFYLAVRYGGKDAFHWGEKRSILELL